MYTLYYMWLSIVLIVYHVTGMITDPKGKLLSLAVIFSGIPIYWMFITNDVMPYSVKAYMS